MTTAPTELRIRAGELTDEHVGMEILNGTRWHSRRRLTSLTHRGDRLVVDTIGYNTITVSPETELVLGAPFLRTDRHQELLDLLRWYARAYSFAGLSPDHLGVARGRAVAFAREALDSGQGSVACQRVIDLQIGPRDPLLTLAQTGATIPELIREAGLELEARAITRDWFDFPWDLPSTERLHAGVRQFDRGHQALVEHKLRDYAAFQDIPAPTLDAGRRSA